MGAHAVVLCKAADLAEGTSRGFDPDSRGHDSVFVVRRNGLHAWRNECPHWSNTRMEWRKDAFLNSDATRIVCSAHGAQFEIDSGLCVIGPCMGETLAPVALTETEDGHLVADVEFLKDIP